MRIKTNETIALIIDYQEKLIPVMNEKETFVQNSVKLIKGMKKLNVPMIVSQQYTKGLGNTVDEIQLALSESKEKFSFVDKISFSCAQNEDILPQIQKFAPKSVIICGCEAHICVLQTVIDLLQMGIQVVLVGDCIASRKEYDMQLAMTRAEKEGALLSTYEAVLFELCEKAGSDTFKYISKLIK